MIKFMKTLNNISRSQTVYRTERVKCKGLCGSHYSFALAICNRPGSSQEELARELCLNKSTATRALAHLQENGYITKESRENDKRQFAVYPTEKLLSVIPDIRKVSGEWMQLISEEIAPWELEVFYSVLTRMEDKAKKVISDKEDA